MSWSNKKINEIRDIKNQEANEIYKKYHENNNETKEISSNEADITQIYSDYEENKNKVEGSPINNERELNQFYDDFKENKEKLVAYKVFIGDYEIPITPEDISFKNDTEPKIFKSIKGKDIIVGVNVLPREVSFESYFPYTVKGATPNRSPKEYKDYFQDLKNKGEKILFQVEGTGESFYAYITKFDYDYIPGKDIDYTITLKEYSEVTENDFEI